MITLVPIVFISFVFSLFNLDSATNKLRRPAVANTLLGISTIAAQICVLKFTHYGIYGVVIIGAALYSVRILGFDLINAALNLGVKLTTFYGVYFKNLCIFAALVLLFFWTSKFVSIANWSEFIAVALSFLGGGYALTFVLFFNKFERTVVAQKILMKFKRR